MQEILITTKPIPLNALYRSVNGRSIISKKGRETKEALEWEIRAGWKGQPLTGDVCMNLIMYFGDKRKRDIDAYLKVLLDSCNGVVYDDDSQITELHCFKLYSKENPRVEMQIL